MRKAVVIRSATQRDRDTVHRLLTAQLIEHRLPADAERIARGLDCAFAPHSPSWLWLAERDGSAAGVMLANENASVERGGLVLWIEELYVAPEARRTGIARALLTRVREEAMRRGIRAIELEVVPTQTAAFALYRAVGFQDVNRQRLSLPL